MLSPFEIKFADVFLYRINTLEWLKKKKKNSLKLCANLWFGDGQFNLHRLSDGKHDHVRPLQKYMHVTGIMGIPLRL